MEVNSLEKEKKKGSKKEEKLERSLCSLILWGVVLLMSVLEL